MKAKRNVVVPLLLALAVTQAQGQDTEANPKEALQELLSKAMIITFSARVLPPDAQADTPMWNAESTKLTIPGRSIKVRLEGDNVQIYLNCTPYIQDDGSVLLLAQGQVWFTEPSDQANKYFSNFYSIPVSFGETVFFFPLGLSDSEARQKDFYNIEVEIKIVPYGQKQ